MRVTLIGKGIGCADAPQNDSSWGICQSLRRPWMKRIIDMNDYSLWGELEAQFDVLSRRFAAKNGIEYVDLTNYPLQAVIDRFGVDYFTSTVDYAIALALYEGFTEIEFYGINMVYESEYEYQKPGAEYWIGRAQGMGVNTIIHGEHSSILKTRDGLLYGYGTPQTRVTG